MKTEKYGIWKMDKLHKFRWLFTPTDEQRITKAMQLGLTPNEARRKQNKLMLRRLTISNATTVSPE